MRYDLFWEERYDILRIIHTYKKSFTWILLKHCYVPHINNLLLILDLFVKPIITCLWHHYWLQDVLWRLTKLWRHKSRGLGYSQFWIILLTLLNLVKLLSRFELPCCSAALEEKLGCGDQKASHPPCFWSAKNSVSNRVEYSSKRK